LVDFFAFVKGDLFWGVRGLGRTILCRGRGVLLCLVGEIGSWCAFGVFFCVRLRFVIVRWLGRFGVWGVLFAFLVFFGRIWRLLCPLFR
jgi:hypothetical protein